MDGYDVQSLEQRGDGNNMDLFHADCGLFDSTEIKITNTWCNYVGMYTLNQKRKKTPQPKQN